MYSIEFLLIVSKTMLAVGDYHTGLLVVIFTYKSAYINRFLLLDLNALVLSSQDLKSTC